MWRRNDRVNERDVPESQHTIFIRGLPGNLSTDEIRQYFEKDFGSCTFDFVKVSPDRSKLYVAVRFDNKSVAREVMEKFGKEGELLGYRAELTWFRDIRRYRAHCAKQGIQPSRYRGDSGRNYRNRGESYRGDRGYSRSPTRSPQRETAEERRSRSHSSAAADSRSPVRSRRSHSSGDDSSPRSEKQDYSRVVVKKERASPSPTPTQSKKLKKRKKEKRQKRRLSPSPSPSPNGRRGSLSDLEMSDGEIPPSVNGKRQNGTENKEIPVGIKPPVEPIQQPQTISIGFIQRQLTAGAIAAATVHEQYNREDQGQKQQKVDLGYPSAHLYQDFKKATPTKFKPIEEDEQKQENIGTTFNKEEICAKRTQLEYSGPPAAIDIRNTPVVSKTITGDGILPLASNNFKEIQRSILQDVRFTNEKEDEEEQPSGVRLSALSRKGMSEEKREERVTKLSPELRERVTKKKRQLELSYRNDCETYGLVVKKLIEKDRALENRLKMALLEMMKDLEVETLKNLDEFLEEISYICP